MATVDFCENTVFITLSKSRKKLLTVLDNIPKDRLQGILSQCKTAFGCSGHVLEENGKELVALQ